MAKNVIFYSLSVLGAIIGLLIGLKFTLMATICFLYAIIWNLVAYYLIFEKEW